MVSERKCCNRNGEVTTECEQWSTGVVETSLRHRSVNREVPLSISSKSAMCSYSKHVRFSWGKYLTNPMSAGGNEKVETEKRKREDLMDREELLLKLQEENKPTYNRRPMWKCWSSVRKTT